MQRTGEPRRAFCIVEGDADSKFYKSVFDRASCAVIPAYSWENVVEVLSRLVGHGVRGVLGIIDADFRRVRGVGPSGNLLWTDSHDLEMDLVASPAFDKVVADLCDETRVETFCGTTSQLRDRILQSALELGYLRLYSERGSLSLRFEGLKVARFVDRNTVNVDVLTMITTVKNLSMRPELDVAHVLAELNLIRSAGHAPSSVCNGHDFTEVMSLALRKAIGTRDTPNDVPAEVIETHLRLAYEATYFHSTRLYAEIRKWEQDNHPFRVLL
jgi:hypothetical protein